MREREHDQHFRRFGLWPLLGQKRRPAIHSSSSDETLESDSIEETRDTTTTSPTPTTIDAPLDTTVIVDVESPQSP